MDAPLGDNQEKNDWITFFKSAHDMTEEDVAAQIKTPSVLQAFELAKFSKLPAEVRASYDDEGREYDRYSQHTAQQIRMAEKSGKIEGKVEGKIEGKIEVARKLLAMNLTMDQIEKATGLSSEDIKSIK
jgi:predicted transposase/invertase (TIGR01784 family)